MKKQFADIRWRIVPQYSVFDVTVNNNIQVHGNADCLLFFPQKVKLLLLTAAGVDPGRGGGVAIKSMHVHMDIQSICTYIC